MLNAFDSYNLTKIDVLDHLDEIKIGVNYRIGGKVIDYMPSTLEEYNKV
jgi:adenylosuccinate synthase